MLHGAGGTGGSPSISMSPSCCRHVSFFMLICPFFMLSPSFSYAPWRKWDAGVSFHLHVSILLSTRFFFYANLSFFYAVSLFFLCSMAQVGRGGLLPSPCLHPVVDTFLFYANLSFFYAVSLFFLCSMAQVGRGGSPSISMSPSCCRHVSFFMLICPFLMLSPSFSYAPWRRWDGGVSFHLHVSILLSTRFFFYANLSFFYAVSLFFLCSMAQVGRGGLLPSPCLHPVVDTFLFLC